MTLDLLVLVAFAIYTQPLLEDTNLHDKFTEMWKFNYILIFISVYTIYHIYT